MPENGFGAREAGLKRPRAAIALVFVIEVENTRGCRPDGLR